MRLQSRASWRSTGIAVLGYAGRRGEGVCAVRSCGRDGGVPLGGVRVSAAERDLTRGARGGVWSSGASALPRDLERRTPAARRAAWERFLTEAPGRWRATWDLGSGVPSRIFGTGIAVAGSVADGSVAESHARDFLVRHGALLAP